VHAALLAALVPVVFAAAALLARDPRRALMLMFCGGAASLGLVGQAALTDMFIGASDSRVVQLDGLFAFDATARLFQPLIAALFTGIAAWCVSHPRPRADGRQLDARYAAFALLFAAAAELAVLSNQAIVTWVLIEATTLAALPLIAHERDKPAWSAAWRYLMISTVGLSLCFLGFACLERAAEVGSGHGELSFIIDQLGFQAHHAQSFAWKLGALLIVFGYGTKLGLAPMYSWMPATYTAAPPPTAGLLAAVQSSAAFLALSRVLPALATNGSAKVVTTALLVMGLSSMAISAIGIVATRNFKHLLGFAAVHHAGVLAIGLAAGGGAAYGVILYAVSNALVKSILFLTAGQIESHFHTQEADKVRGLLVEMPFAGIFLMFGSFALLGFAPFGSFLGEIGMLGGLIDRGHVVVFTMMCALMLVVFVATGRALFPMIWNAGGADDRRRRESRLDLAAKALFLAFLLTLGIYTPEPLADLLVQVARSLGGL
jgi:hydrogenase-4 component F